MVSNSSKAHLKIIVDGDSCPVKDIIFRVAEETSVPVLLVASVSHVMNLPVGNINFISVDNIPQAADIAIINRVSANDIVITGDYGLASVIIAKEAVPLSPRGYIFDVQNIDTLLLKRHLESKVRRGGGKTKGPKAFTLEERQEFERVLRELITRQK